MHHRLMLVAVVVLGAVAAAPGQEPAVAVEPASPMAATEDPTLNQGGVIVADNYAALDAVRRARLAIEAARRGGDWNLAAEAVLDTITRYGEHLIEHEPRARRNLADMLNELVLTWPAEGLQAYVAMAEARADEARASAYRTQDVAALLTAGQQFFATPSGARAISDAADLVADRGQPAAAARLLSRLLTHPSVDRASVLARLAAWKQWAGRPEQAQSYADQMDQLLAKDAPLRGRVDLALQELPPLDLSAAPAAMLGGDESRTRLVGSAADPGAAMWTTVFRDLNAELNATSSGREDEAAAINQQIERGAFLSSMPAVADHIVVLQDDQWVRAFSATSGEKLWEQKLFEVPREPYRYWSGRSTSLPLRMNTPTIANGRVYVSFAMPMFTPYQRVGENRAGMLACLELQTGRELWRVQPLPRRKQLPERLNGASFDASPLVIGSRVYAVARRLSSAGMAAPEDVYLTCFDADRGDLLWHTVLASAPPVDAAGGQTYLAAHAGLVFATTQAGAVVAVDGLTGRIAWLRLYDRIEATPASMYMQPETDRLAWQITPAFVENDSLITMPSDAQALLQIDWATGRIIRQVERDDLLDADLLIGMNQGVLYGVGTDGRRPIVFGMDLATQQVVFQRVVTGALFGRPAMTRTAIFVPTRERLLRFGLTEQVETSSFRRNENETTGHVVVLPEQVLIAGSDALSSFCRWEDARARLQAAIDANPRDPEPRLTFAEVAMRADPQNLPLALEQLDRAAELAGGWALIEPQALRRRLFRTCLSFAQDAAEQGRLSPREIETLFDRALRCPPDAESHVRALIAAADFFRRHQRGSDAVARLQRILDDRELRTYMVVNAEASGRSQAGLIAEAAIQNLISDMGPSIYADVERRAASAVADRPLADAAASFPNARAVAEAKRQQALQARAADRVDQAYRLLSGLWSSSRERLGEAGDSGELLMLLADAAWKTGRTTRAIYLASEGDRLFGARPFKLDGRELTFATFQQELQARHVNLPRPLPAVSAELPNQYVITGLREVLHPAVTGPATRRDLLVVAREGGLVVLKADTAEQVSEVAVPNLRGLAPLIDIQDDYMLLALADRFARVQISTGQRLWPSGELPTGQLNADPELAVLLRSATLAGDVLVGARGRADGTRGELFAISAQTGDTLWTRPADPMPAGPMTASDDGLMVYATGDGTTMQLRVISLATGQELHVFDSAANSRFARYGFAPNGTLIAMSTSKLYGFNAATGRPAFVPVEVERNRLDLNTLAFSADGFYVMHDGRLLTKRRFEDAEVLWNAKGSFVGTDATIAPAELFVEPDAIYVTNFRQVDAIRPSDGDVLWQGVPRVNNFVSRANTQEFLLALHIRPASFPDHQQPPDAPPANAGAANIGPAGAGAANAGQVGAAAPMLVRQVCFYRKFTAGKPDGRLVAELPLGTSDQPVKSFVVRENAVGMELPGQVVMRTAAMPVSPQIDLGDAGRTGQQP